MPSVTLPCAPAAAPAHCAPPALDTVPEVPLLHRRVPLDFSLMFGNAYFSPAPRRDLLNTEFQAGTDFPGTLALLHLALASGSCSGHACTHHPVPLTRVRSFPPGLGSPGPCWSGCCFCPCPLPVSQPLLCPVASCVLSSVSHSARLLGFLWSGLICSSACRSFTWLFLTFRTPRLYGVVVPVLRLHCESPAEARRHLA